MAEIDEIKNNIREFIRKNFLMGSNAIKFSDTDSFMNKGIVDSTGVLELVQFIQKTFNIMIEDRELIPENLDSVNQIASFLIQKKVVEKTISI